MAVETRPRDAPRTSARAFLGGIRRPPRPLSALLGASLLLTLAWSLLIPPFHAPDEDEHYVYVQSLGENFKLPPHHSYVRPGPQFSPAVRLAEQYARTRSYWLVDRGSARPPWDGAAEKGYAAAIRSRPPSSSHIDSAAYSGTDPPLYHAYAAIAYTVVPSSNVFSRLFAMRVWTVPLVLLTVLGAWLLAGELFGRARPLQLIAAGAVGLQPMITFMSGGVNPDAAAYAAGAFVLWLGVRALRDPDRATVIGLAASVAAGALVKTALLTLVPAAAVALAIGLHRTGRLTRRVRRVAIPAAAVLIAVAIVVVVVATPVGTSRSASLSGFLRYLWEFYLPRLPSQAPVTELPAHPFYSIWFRGAWGVFGAGDVHLGAVLYRVLAVVSVATFAGAVVAFVRRRVPLDRAVLVFFALAVVGLVLGLHVADYLLIARDGSGTAQGRYLLPLVPIAGVALAVAVTNFRRRWRLPAAAVALSSMLALNLVSLGIVAGRFYA